MLLTRHDMIRLGREVDTVFFRQKRPCPQLAILSVMNHYLTELGEQGEEIFRRLRRAQRNRLRRGGGAKQFLLLVGCSQNGSGGKST